jgi:hypothetical protein
MRNGKIGHWRESRGKDGWYWREGRGKEGWLWRESRGRDGWQGQRAGAGGMRGSRPPPHRHSLRVLPANAQERAPRQQACAGSGSHRSAASSRLGWAAQCPPRCRRATPGRRTDRRSARQPWHVDRHAARRRGRGGSMLSPPPGQDALHIDRLNRAGNVGSSRQDESPPAPTSVSQQALRSGCCSETLAAPVDLGTLHRLWSSGRCLRLGGPHTWCWKWS